MSALHNLGAGLKRKFEVWAALTTVMLKEICNYFVSNLFCKTSRFVDDKLNLEVKV
jgi:hypothetical protein